MTEQEAKERARQAVVACTHACQWTDTSLVACEACVARELLRAVQEEKEATFELLRARGIAFLEVCDAIRSRGQA